MIRDALYRQIIERLNGTLDPELFEQCVADLLSSIHPGLVPIKGGSDAGMDGAIADGHDEPYPLITTTGQDVIGNLTRNLNKQLEEADTRHLAVLATSRYLTPQKRRNLFARARELRFTLLQVYDQTAIANLLYRSPTWRRELLNLSGNPPPLSAFPLSDRPLLNAPLIGREQDLNWLQETPGDRLLVGQPGSGKTFLLHKLVEEGQALFVISNDRGEIADGLRAGQPSILIVDDAQNAHQVLRNLRQMREELGVEFSIIASCWPGERDTISQILNLPQICVRKLELLTQDEIVEVIKEAGLYGPPHLVQEIVTQAEGRPGLAVTLTYLCLQGSVREVALGNALSRSLLTFFTPIVGHQASLILATIALGGDTGISMSTVADSLSLTILDVRNAIVQLAAGGVILDLDGKRLSVRPPVLRSALIRDIFFLGATSYSIELVLEKIDTQKDAVFEIIGAMTKGAVVPPRLIQSLIERTPSPTIFKEYASLGAEETHWILQRWPQTLGEIVEAALHYIPREVLPALFQQAIGNNHPLHSFPDHPIRIIQSWIYSAGVGADGIAKRQAVLETAEDWFMTGGDLIVGYQALSSIMSPRFEYSRLKPGSGDAVTFTFGMLSLEGLQTLQKLWPRVLKLIKNNFTTHWKYIHDLIENWVYPARISDTIPKEIYDFVRTSGFKMLEDVVSLAPNRPGIVRWALQIYTSLNIQAPFALDADFETLYPPRDFGENWQQIQEQQTMLVTELSKRWATTETPQEIINKIKQYETEAEEFQINYPRLTPLLCDLLAKQTQSSLEWAKALIAQDCPPDLVEPFLHYASQDNNNGWQETAHKCLNDLRYRGMSIAIALSEPNSQDDLIEAALGNLKGYRSLISTLYIRNQVSENLSLRLLSHPDPEIVVAAAGGEWQSKPEASVRKSLLTVWRQAVISLVIGEYWLSQVFINDSQLAYEWLQARLENIEGIRKMMDERELLAAIRVLDTETRRRLLHQMPDKYEIVKLIKPLIDEHLDLYQELLRTMKLSKFHLVPLAEMEGSNWVEKAFLALNAGYTIEQVAESVYGYLGTISWSGDESKMWQGWVEKFETLCSHSDERIRQIGAVGKKRAETRMYRAQNDEKLEAIYGYDWRRRRAR